jgi:hypothetical protein
MPFGSAPSNESIALLVLEWAKDNHPDWYKETLKVAMRPDVFRTYLLRLVEKRCESEPTWKATVPVMVLEETRVTCRVRDRQTNDVLEFKGRKANDRVWAFKELTLDTQEFRQLAAAKTQLDLTWTDQQP